MSALKLRHTIPYEDGIRPDLILKANKSHLEKNTETLLRNMHERTNEQKTSLETF